MVQVHPLPERHCNQPSFPMLPRSSLLLPPPLPFAQYLESERSGAKGHKLFTVTFLPDPAAGPPTAVLCWHHGIAEHIGRYRQSEPWGRLAEE